MLSSTTGRQGACFHLTECYFVVRGPIHSTPTPPHTGSTAASSGQQGHRPSDNPCKMDFPYYVNPDPCRTRQNQQRKIPNPESTSRTRRSVDERLQPRPHSQDLDPPKRKPRPIRKNVELQFRLSRAHQPDRSRPHRRHGSRPLASTPHVALRNRHPEYRNGFPDPGLRKELREIRRRRQRAATMRSEEHTSELQSHSDLVCRL